MYPSVKFTVVGEVPLPVYKTDGASGMDLSACLPDGPIVLQPRGRTLVPTGLKLQIPGGYEGQIRPRSGPAKTHGITVLNAPGTIDSDYRGEIGVLLVNLGNLPVVVSNLDRIAQIAFAPVAHLDLELVEEQELALTDRGEDGFGSTGVAA